MFPNYVLTKSTNDFEYNVPKWNSTVQNAMPQRSRCRPLNTGRNQSKVKTVVPSPKRPKRQKKSTTSSVATSTQTATKDPTSRSVAFRIESGSDRSPTPRDRKTVSVAQTSNMCTNPSPKTHCNLQESFTDFFSIMHDNVLKSVKEAVQEMMAKCFEQSMAQMERLSQEIRNQEAQLQKINQDLMSKIAAQSEANLNQFKFLTQMLIDNQTVHYRALNQAKQNKQHRLEERELEKEQKLERERERKRSGSTIKGKSYRMDPAGDSNQVQFRNPQHMLYQQQQPVVYQICEEYRRTNAPQLQWESTSNSMPNLSRNPLRSPPGVSKRPGSRSNGNKPDREVCIPVMTYPPCTITRRSI